MSTITDQITNAANSTAQMQSKQPKETGAASTKVSTNDFLLLMMKQLQCQDPLNPTDNKDFLAQTAQFTQLSTTQDMSKNIATNNSIMQTLTLVGKDVVLVDPNDSSKTITGTVSEAKFTSEGANIVVNGKEYPISLVKSVTESTSNTQNTTKDVTSVGNDIIQNIKELPTLLAKELKNFISNAYGDSSTTNNKNNT